ncbi:unannotated protein [freshwater metagenome]|uniref:Unannotated protein n=1 Tax=freshwater metagenome TaxID=449393 RepID=A0A6J7QST7_9ZZZZ
MWSKCVPGIAPAALSKAYQPVWVVVPCTQVAGETDVYESFGPPVVPPPTFEVVPGDVPPVTETTPGY